MTKATHAITKSPRKRAAGTGTPVLVRIQSDGLVALDRWRKKQADMPSRPEAIRRLVEFGMKEWAKK
ncbi:hypothetical protein [Aestuariivirga sp.]|uniref:hypothetical protein n=1 Tax=Aestuariivirga sp. TaxID=2650926 RepID=UPI0035B2BC35